MKRKHTIIDKDKLTVKQQAFVNAYTNPDSNTLGNGTQAAMQAYDTKSIATASDIASKNLRNPLIRHRVDRILDAIG